MDFLRQLGRDIADAWRRLTISARVNIGLAFGLTIAIIIVLVAMSGREHFVQLFGKVSLTDAAAMTAYLDDNNIPYKTEYGGQIIKVPSKYYTTASVALSDMGLPKQQSLGPGFSELFNEPDLTSNQWLQDMNYVRAVMGEAQRQLNNLDYIEKSSVFIREAEDQFFRSDQRPSTASVTITAKRKPTDREIRTILNIVAGFGGELLKPDDITLVDTNLGDLHLPPRDDFEAVANSQLDYKSDVERRAEAAIVENFKRAGIEAIAQVSARLDFSQTHEVITEPIVDSNPVSAMSTSRTSTSKESLPEGPAGLSANMPDSVSPGSNETTETEEETVENYEVGSTVTERTTNGPKVLEYVAAVWVDANKRKPILDENGEDTGEKEYVPPTAQEIEAYTDMVIAAVGPELDRENASVTDMPFKMDSLASAQMSFEAVERAARYERYENYGITIGKLLLVVVGFLVVRSLFRKAVVELVEEEEEELTEEMGPTEEALRQAQIAEDLERIAKEDPEAMAMLLRMWINEQEE